MSKLHIPPSPNGIWDLIDDARSAVPYALGQPPTSITFVAEGDQDAIVISWTLPTSSPRAGHATTSVKLIANGPSDTGFYAAREAIKNSGKTSDRDKERVGELLQRVEQLEQELEDERMASIEAGEYDD